MEKDFNRQKDLFLSYMRNCDNKELDDILNRLEKVKPGIKKHLLARLQRNK